MPLHWRPEVLPFRRPVATRLPDTSSHPELWRTTSTVCLDGRQLTGLVLSRMFNFWSIVCWSQSWGQAGFGCLFTLMISSIVRHTLSCVCQGRRRFSTAECQHEDQTRHAFVNIIHVLVGRSTAQGGDVRGTAFSTGLTHAPCECGKAQ